MSSKEVFRSSFWILFGGPFSFGVSPLAFDNGNGQRRTIHEFLAKISGSDSIVNKMQRKKFNTFTG